MKLALSWYYCGLGLFCLGTVMVIWGIAAGKLSLIAKGASGLLFGLWWYRIGAGKIRKAKLEKANQPGQLKELNAFQKENCVGCRFANEEALKKDGDVCVRRESPECDGQYCYSRELREKTA